MVDHASALEERFCGAFSVTSSFFFNVSKSYNASKRKDSRKVCIDEWHISFLLVKVCVTFLIKYLSMNYCVSILKFPNCLGLFPPKPFHLHNVLFIFVRWKNVFKHSVLLCNFVWHWLWFTNLLFTEIALVFIDKCWLIFLKRFRNRFVSFSLQTFTLCQDASMFYPLNEIFK